jgi:cytochrome c-type biogenesis protein CcsB
MKLITRLLPWALLALFVTEIIAVFAPKSDRGFHLREFGRLPALLNGRVQPFDSVGRNSLLQIRSTASVPLEEKKAWQFWKHPKKLKATEWLLEVMTRPYQADERPIFLVHHPELLRTLRLDEQGVEKSGLRYYSYRQIEPLSHQIEELAAQFSEVQDKLRTPYQRQLLKLHRAKVIYERLKLSLQPPGTEDFARELAEFEQITPAGTTALRAREAGQEHDTNALVRFAEPAGGFIKVANAALPLLIPPREADESRDHWVNLGVGVMESLRQGEMHPAIRSFAAIASAFRHGNVAGFNQAVAEYRQWLSQRFPAEVRKGRAEFYFNEVQSFLHAMIIYLCAFVLAGGALLTFAIAPTLAEAFRRSAVWLIGLAFVVHTFGLIFRMALEGRPPVTNLYSSAIFIGWGAVVLGLGLERFFKVGLGSVVAALAGFVTLIIAHNLAVGGDTMEMLQAVLDTNFWLATHVTTVTLGYASTFVAGLLGIAYIVLGLCTPLLSQKLGARSAATMSAGLAIPGGTHAGVGAARSLRSEVGKTEIGSALAKMIYAIVCFATLFSFIGTVLGGIWADQSWGRFWGWDPKENGALIIVLWNALILHARWGGYARERGLAVLSIVGNIVTSYSWFGVNMIGIGLHSYGFMDAAFKWLMAFVASQLVLIGLGCLPKRFWVSFRDKARSAEGPARAEAGRAKARPATA